MPGRAEGLGPSPWGDHHGLRPSTCHIFWASSSQEAFSREVRAPGCPVTRGKDASSAPHYAMWPLRGYLNLKLNIQSLAAPATFRGPGISLHQGRKLYRPPGHPRPTEHVEEVKEGRWSDFSPNKPEMRLLKVKPQRSLDLLGRLCGRSPANCWEDSRQAGWSPPPHPQQGPL